VGLAHDHRVEAAVIRPGELFLVPVSLGEARS